MFESCLEIRRQFSDFVDAECSSATRQSVRYHLNHCGACRLELERYRLLFGDLRSLPRRRLSALAELRFNVALSRARYSNVLGSLKVRLQNAVRPLVLPATGAVLAGLICLGLTLDWLIVPPARADASTVTPARLESLAPLDLDTGREGLVLVTHVNAGGQVVDYKVVSGVPSPELKSELDRLMYFSVFRPATMLGEPTDAQVVLSLRRITVRGGSVHERDESTKPLLPPPADPQGKARA
ncbi:MAG TPA: zf-HC2 domain-containing protein [Terriglobia bacterium]|nr:zf-HC2 domain-containing protein [Terriglobia bacterium]